MRRLTPQLLTPLILTITLAGCQDAPASSTAAAEDTVVLAATVSPARDPLVVTAAGSSAPNAEAVNSPILSSGVWAARSRQAAARPVSKAIATVSKVDPDAVAAGRTLAAV